MLCSSDAQSIVREDLTAVTGPRPVPSGQPWLGYHCNSVLHASVFRSVFSGFLAIFGKFEARGRSFEFSHESGRKKSQKKSVTTRKNWFFFCVFLAHFHGRTQRISPWLQICQKWLKNRKKPDLKTLLHAHPSHCHDSSGHGIGTCLPLMTQ